MSNQTEIKLGKPKVVGIDPQYSGLVVVRIPLTPSPDQHWTEIFNRTPPGVSYSVSMERPKVGSGGIELRVAENQVEKGYEAARAFAEGANRYYAERIEPQLRRQREEREREEAERKQRLADAQRRLDQLTEESSEEADT
jgi:hypothetical protein